jgi:hypothetical protein
LSAPALLGAFIPFASKFVFVFVVEFLLAESLLPRHIRHIRLEDQPGLALREVEYHLGEVAVCLWVHKCSISFHALKNKAKERKGGEGTKQQNNKTTKQQRTQANHPLV